MIISSKFTLFVALFAIAFTAIAALPIEDADSFEDGLLDVEETPLSLIQDTDVQDDVKGLDVKYYNLGGQISKLPDFSALKPTSTDVSAQINFPSTDGNFATSGSSQFVGAVWMMVQSSLSATNWSSTTTACTA